MARAKVTVAFSALASVVRQYGPGPMSDLLGVEFCRTVPADTEFPKQIASMDLFVRFFVVTPGDAKFRVEIWQLSRTFEAVALVERYAFTRSFLPGQRSSDVSFRLPHAEFPNAGDYSVVLKQRVRSGWRGKAWRTMSQTFMELRRDSP